MSNCPRSSRGDESSVRTRVRAWAFACLLAWPSGAAAAPLDDDVIPPVSAEPWSYVSPPLTGHCLQTYRLFLPPEPLEPPPDGWPVLIQVALGGFAGSDNVTQLVPESVLYHVAQAGIAVVAARCTPSVLLDDPYWVEQCGVAPDIPGHGLLHAPGYVPPDLVSRGIAPYGDPAYDMCIKDAVMIVQRVRHLARGTGPFATDEEAALAQLDPDLIGLAGRSAGAAAAAWVALGPERRDDAPFAGLGGAYDESTRVQVAMLSAGTLWFPLFRDDLQVAVGFFGAGGHSETPFAQMGDADPWERFALSALAYDDRALTGALPVYMHYNEPSVAKKYAPKTKGCAPLPFCFPGQGQDGVLGVHPAWNGYAWKRRHPARTRLVLSHEGAYAQRGSVAATFVEPGPAQFADQVGWLRDAFARVRTEQLADSVAQGFIVPGDRVRATLAQDASLVVAFEGVAGSRVSFVARRADGELQPGLVLRGPDGEPRLGLDETIQGPKVARVKKHELDATGLWTLTIANVGPAPGDVAVTSRAKRPPPIDVVLPLGGDAGVDGLDFDAVGGMEVRAGRVWRVKPPPGSSVPLQVASELQPAVEDVASANGFVLDLGPLADANAKGTAVKVAPFEVPSLGTFTLGIGALDDSEGFVRVRLRRVLPRGREELHLEDAPVVP